MRRTTLLGAAALLAAALAACSSSGKPQADTTPPATPTAATPTATTPTATPPATAPAPGATGSQKVTVDPCALMTQQEASHLAHGRSFGPGKPETDPGGGKRCVYGGQTRNVFEVIVAQGTSVKQAQAVKNQMVAEAKAKLGAGIGLTHVAGLGDDAYSIYHTLSEGGVNIQISAVYVLSGTVGIALVDETVDGDAPSTSALVAQANTAIGRLP